jgi:hypothetical protein
MKLDPIERVPPCTADEFQRRYVDAARPVILEGLARDWPARTKWTLPYFKATFGQARHPVRSSDDEFEYLHGSARYKAKESRPMLLGDYFDLVGRVKAGDPRPPYLGNISLTRPPLSGVLGHMLADVRFPPYFAGKGEQEVRVWLGAAGQRSMIHNDGYHNLNVQLTGEKRFLLFAPEEYVHLYTEMQNPSCWGSPVDFDAPDLAKYPLFAEARGQEGTLGAGDLLYIPLFWWHGVRALAMSININKWVYQTGERNLWQQS